VTRAKTANLEYEQQCEIEVIYTAQIVEQISGYLFIDTVKQRTNWHEWNKDEWKRNEYEMKQKSLVSTGVRTPEVSVLR